MASQCQEMLATVAVSRAKSGPDASTCFYSDAGACWRKKHEQQEADEEFLCG